MTTVNDLLLEILTKINSIYEELDTLEQQKGEVIRKRDGKLLEVLVKQQEEKLRRIDQLEKERLDLVTRISRQSGVPPHELTLKRITENSPSDLLVIEGQKLKNILRRLKRQSLANERCLKDNLEFYNLLVKGLRAETNIDKGYSQDGRIQNFSSGRSALFNQTV